MNGVQVPLTVDMRDYSCVVGNGEGWMNIVFYFMLNAMIVMVVVVVVIKYYPATTL